MATLSLYLYLDLPFTLLPLSFLFVGLLTAICGWALLSGRVIIKSTAKKTVVFCFDVDPEGQRYFNRILKEIRSKLIELGLAHRLRVVNAAPDIVKNIEDVNRYRANNSIDLVVWGTSVYGHEDGKKVLKFSVHHTVSLSPSLRAKLNVLIADVGIIFLRRDWTIKEANDLVDVQTLGDNLFETCLYILGIHLYDEKNFDGSAKILEAILPSLDQKAISTKATELILQAGRVRALLSELYLIKAHILHESGKDEEVLPVLKQLSHYGPNQVLALMLFARAHFLKGDLNGAQIYTKEIRQIDKKHPAVAINFAFFGIVQKNYERTRFWYDEILKLREMRGVDPFSVVAFLENEYRKNPSEHAYLYGLGIVNGFVDAKIRKSDLGRFLRLTKDREEYIVLRRRAQELMGRTRTR